MGVQGVASITIECIAPVPTVVIIPVPASRINVWICARAHFDDRVDYYF